MRAAILTLTIAISSSLAQAATFEARSPHYILTVDRTAEQYAVRIVSQGTDQTVFSESIPATRGPHEISRDVGDLHFAVQLSSSLDALTVNLDVEQNGMIADSIHTVWSLAPREARPRDVLEVGGDVKAPIVLQQVNPEYTEEARAKRVSGIAIVRVLIDKNGVVKDAEVVKPLPFGLTDSAVAAVKRWTFAPATLHGQPVDVHFNLVVRFKPD